MWGFLSPIRQAVGGNGTTGTRGPPVTPASCAKAKENHLLGATPGADRDMLVKVTFHAIHDSAPENAAMYLTGSLPSLGSWAVKRARKMNRAPNGSWALAIYIPEKAEFLYQYLLIQEPEDGSAVQEPIVLWEGGLERKCKLVERCCRPSTPHTLQQLPAFARAICGCKQPASLRSTSYWCPRSRPPVPLAVRIAPWFSRMTRAARARPGRRPRPQTLLPPPSRSVCSRRSPCAPCAHRAC